MLVFTDGLSDAFDRNGGSVGIERLQGICEGSRQSSPTKLLGWVLSEGERFAQGQPQHDDMAAAVFRCGDA